MAESSQLPARIMGHYDVPFWDALDDGVLTLQRCTECGTFRYPPGPICHSCLNEDAEWVPVQGTGIIVTYAIFHKKYLPGYEPPYNVVAVRLAEGPIMITNLTTMPTDDDIGKSVELVIAAYDDYRLPRFQLADEQTSLEQRG